MFAHGSPRLHPAESRKLRREKKLTIDELAERLGVPPPAYYWVRDMPNPAPDRRQVRCHAQRKGKRRNAGEVPSTAHRGLRAGPSRVCRSFGVPNLSYFVNLYMAEGYKRSRNVVSLANSDPAIIRVADQWIRCFAQNPVTYAIQYHADQDPEYLRRFWAFGLGADPQAIRHQRKSNSNQLAGRTWRCRWGVITVSANDTRFRMRLEGWIHCLKALWLDSAV